MNKVFISYRREDSRDASGRICDRLITDLGRDEVFMDVDNIPPGVDFRDHLKTSVQQCDVLLAIIGPGWLDSVDEAGNRRIDQADDFVRIEIELALKQMRTLVIPVLLHGTRMPRQNELPGSLQKLAFCNAVNVEHREFQRDLDLLVSTLRSKQQKQSSKSSPTTSLTDSTPETSGLSPQRSQTKPPRVRAAKKTTVKKSRPPTVKGRRSAESWQVFLAVVVAVLITFIVVGLVTWRINSWLKSNNEIVPFEKYR